MKNRNLRNLGPEDWDGDGQNDNESTFATNPRPVNGGETAIVHGEVVTIQRFFIALKAKKQKASSEAFLLFGKDKPSES